MGNSKIVYGIRIITAFILALALVIYASLLKTETKTLSDATISMSNNTFKYSEKCTSINTCWNIICDFYGQEPTYHIDILLGDSKCINSKEHVYESNMVAFVFLILFLIFNLCITILYLLDLANIECIRIKMKSVYCGLPVWILYGCTVIAIGLLYFLVVYPASSISTYIIFMMYTSTSSIIFTHGEYYDLDNTYERIPI